MPLLSDVGVPGGGDPDGPRFQPNFRVLEYKLAAHRAAALGLFVSLALGVAFGSRGIVGLLIGAALFVIAFAVMRWALLREKAWARRLGILTYGAVGVVMILSALVSVVVLIGAEGASTMIVIVNGLLWFAGGICLFIYPKRWFSQT